MLNFGWGHSFEDYRQPIKSANEKPIKDDQALRTKLKQASKNVPKYLFRMWHAKSGGDRKLNTTTAITPFAFAASKGHKSVYDMTRSEFIKNTMSHLGGAVVLTEFSSWSHSPYFAFYYAHRRKSSGSVHVAIIDTEELAKSNPAFHVPALGKILGRGDYDYEEEYLIHGVIEGQFYKAVSYDKLCELDLLKHLPALSSNTINPFDVRRIRAIPGDEINYTIDELRQLRSIALSYGDTFSLPMAIVLFCCKKRPGYWSQLSTSDLETIIKVLGGWKEIPQDWSSSRSVFSKTVYPANWDANTQVQNLMHALYTHCYGRGARGNEARYAAKNENSVEVLEEEEDIVGAMAAMSVSRGDAVEASTAGHADEKMTRKPTQKRARGFAGAHTCGIHNKNINAPCGQKAKSKKKCKTYSSRDSPVVTHQSTNLPFNCLCMAERTGCPVFS
ncbi:hypothetical protein KCU71_g17994, partial [Aureobasidium melanogenum]